MKTVIKLLPLVALLGFAGCADMTTSERNVLGGTAIGAIGGSLIGGGTGALIGAGAGALGGALYDSGSRHHRHHHHRYYRYR